MDYISREALFKLIGTMPFSPITDREERIIRAFISTVENFPAADVVPVRHGRWVKKRDNACYWYECSECGEKPPKDQWRNQWLSSYCPNCGAKMEETE